MTRQLLLLVLLSVGMSSLAQVLLKSGMSSPSVTAALDSPGLHWTAARLIAEQPLVLAGLAVYFASVLVWLFVLARLEVSLAYPFVGLGFVITMIAGWLVHGDVLTPTRVLGTLLIASGVVVLARS